MTKGEIYTVAGNGTAGYSGDGGPATKAPRRACGGKAQPGGMAKILIDIGEEALGAAARFYSRQPRRGRTP
jgi:hypothetical protein